MLQIAKVYRAVGKVGRWTGGETVGKGACGSGKTEAAGVRESGSVISWFLKCGEGP